MATPALLISPADRISNREPANGARPSIWLSQDVFVGAIKLALCHIVSAMNVLARSLYTVEAAAKDRLATTDALVKVWSVDGRSLLLSASAFRRLISVN